jgi:L-threonylcarbamoyladenylate synthase
MDHEVSLPSNNFRLQLAVRVIANGGVIAYPTEAVWGLGCDPWNAAAVQRLLQLKRRPQAKGLILVAANSEQLHWLLWDLPDAWRDRLDRSWPGPVTWLIPHKNRVPAWISGSSERVAVRVSAHTGIVALCGAAGRPLVSTSANSAGAQAARESFQLRRYFGTGLDYIVPGRLGDGRRPSMIRDLASDTLVRTD